MLSIFPFPGLVWLEAGDPAAAAPGLIGRYSSLDGKRSFQRIDPKLSFDWRDGLPDERLSQGPFRAGWSGRLFVPEDGGHRFSLQALGRAEVRLDGQVVARAGDPPGAAPPPEVSLDYGHHDLRVDYESAASEGALALRWQAGESPPQIIPAPYLSHDAGAESAMALDLAYERGRRLAGRLGCGRCHQNQAAPPGDAGEAPKAKLLLDRAGWLRESYLRCFLRHPQEARPGTPMPGRRGDAKRVEEESEALAAFLASASEPPPPSPEFPPGSARRGRELFYGVGCGACHDPESEEPADRLAPSRLDDTGSKWPLAPLVLAITHPGEFPLLEAMPIFKIEQLEAVDLAAYLGGFESAACGEEVRPLRPDLAAEGKKLFLERGCGACHEAPGLKSGEAEAPAAPDLTGQALRGLPRGCLSAEDTRLAVPLYDLPEDAVLDLSAYYERSAAPEASVSLQEKAARRIREELGCTRCHGRDGAGGEEILRSLARAGQSPALNASSAPPDLSGLGHRLKPSWIRSAIGGEAEPVRPWLTLRMPQYFFWEDDAKAFVESFIASDRGPALDPARSSAGAEKKPPRQDGSAAGEELRLIGALLLGPKGFNCLQCHALGRHRPEVNTPGPDLTWTGRRLEKSWFFTWIGNPQRLRPGTPMPSYEAAIAGVLGEDLQAQMEAVWSYLAETPRLEFELGKSPGQSLRPEAGRPLLVQSRVLGPGALNAERGVAIALPPSQAALLFDAGRLSWLGSWRGAFLEREGQHGAHARWRVAGEPLGEDRRRLPPIFFRREKGAPWTGPALFRERFGWFRRAANRGSAVEIEYRLRHPEGGWLRAAERLEAGPARPGSLSVERTVTLLDLEAGGGKPPGGEILIAAAPVFSGFADPPRERDRIESGAPIEELPALTWPRGSLRAEGSGRRPARWSWAAAAPGKVSFPVIQPFTDDPIPAGALFPPREEEGIGLIALACDSARASGQAVKILVEWPANEEEKAPLASAAAPPAASIASPKPLPASLPEGYSLERLPLPADFLPSALCFFQGKLLAAGYDGELRWVVDSDGDALPDRYSFFAGPIDQANSLLARGEAVLAASPGAIYAIRDRDGDNVADDYETLSSQWDWSGHSFDFFFGFGVGRDGSLFGSNSTPFERGDIPGRWHRGAILKIAPDGTASVHAAGNRLEFGWAADREGRNFFTVNQGPWTVSNSIAELQEGAHYGYHEKDFARITPPVVRAPYPWCRSLTGLAFAETGGRFGPFEGQGFAGDFNTRRLIRWTHYEFGAARQGACYDFCDGFEEGPTGLCFGPDGALYVAALIDGVWIVRPPRGGIYRLAAAGQSSPGAPAPVPFEVEEARAIACGFEVRLTLPVDPATVPAAASKVHRFFYQYRQGYFSDEVEREDVAVERIELREDRRALRLVLARPHLAPRIYRLKLDGLRSADGRPLRTAPFFATVNAVPAE